MRAYLWISASVHLSCSPAVHTLYRISVRFMVFPDRSLIHIHEKFRVVVTAYKRTRGRSPRYDACDSQFRPVSTERLLNGSRRQRNQHNQLKRGFQPGQDLGFRSYDWKGMYRIVLPSQYSVHLIKLTRSRVAKSPREGV